MSKAVVIRNLVAEGFPLTAKFIHAFYKEARTLSIKYGLPQDYQDICQLALIEAVRLEPKFDSKKGTCFFTFVRRPLRHVIQKIYGYSKASTNLYNKISKFSERYHEEHSLMPNITTISKALNITEIKIRSVFYGKPLKVSVEALGPDFSLHNEPSSSETLVDGLLEGVSLEDATLVREYYLEGYSLEELSTIYRIPIGSISNKLAQIIKTLKETNG